MNVARCIGGLHGGEPDSLPPVRVFLYDVAVALLILPCVTNTRPAKAVQLAYQLLGDAQLRAPLVDKSQRVAVAAHLFLVPVARVRFTEDDRPDPRPVYLDALDPVRGDRALDDRVLAQNLQPLRRLPGEEFLPAARLAEVCEIPARRQRDGFEPPPELLECFHLETRLRLPARVKLTESDDNIQPAEHLL